MILATAMPLLQRVVISSGYLSVTKKGNPK